MIQEDCIEANRHLMEAFVRAPAAVPLAEGAVLEDVAQGCTYQGRAAVAALLQALFVESFSEARVGKQTMLVDKYAGMVEFIFHGRQDGPFLGLPATGREATVRMVLVCQIVHEEICRATLYYDAGSLLRQLGMAI